MKSPLFLPIDLPEKQQVRSFAPSVISAEKHLFEHGQHASIIIFLPGPRWTVHFSGLFWVKAMASIGLQKACSLV